MSKTASGKDSKWIDDLPDLSVELKDVVRTVFEESKDTLASRNRVEQMEAAGLPILTEFKWRLDIEVASRNVKSSFKPGFLTSLTLEAADGTSTNSVCMSMDGAMIKKVGEEMKMASSMPRSITYRKLNRGMPAN